MRLSIRFRVVIALNAFALCLTLALGWIAREVAGQIVEERFAKEMVAGVSKFLSEKGFPYSDSMMGYLREIFNADWAVMENGTMSIVASSLTPSQKDELSRIAGSFGKSGAIFLGGKKYRMDSSEVHIPARHPGEPASCRLYMLVPYAIFQEARDMASARVTRIIWIAAFAATMLAILFAFTITRPIRRLAAEMDSFSEKDAAVSSNLNNSAIKGPSEITRLAASFHKLTERLAAARTELARNERLATLGKVCLSVAHELRNPLSGIKMNVRVLKDSVEPLSPDSLGIETILKEIDRMELYLSELMNLSPDAQPLQRGLNCTQVKLSDLAESVLNILEGRCRHAKIIVQRNYAPDESSILADGDQLRQAMMNLIVNAIEAMPNGGTMAITVGGFPDSAVFSVGDTGTGVRCAGRNIFDAFVSDKPNGVGLGLYLCKQIVNRHGGSIKCESSENGAVFRFELPIRTTAITGSDNASDNSKSEHYQ